MPKIAADSELVSDLIDGSIGRYSLFHKTFGYYGDGVSPSANDISIAKLTAWREKDQVWLREALRSGIAKADRIAALLQTELSPNAPAPEELARRLGIASYFPPSE